MCASRVSNTLHTNAGARLSWRGGGKERERGREISAIVFERVSGRHIEQARNRREMNFCAQLIAVENYLPAFHDNEAIALIKTKHAST